MVVRMEFDLDILSKMDDFLGVDWEKLRPDSLQLVKWECYFVSNFTSLEIREAPSKSKLECF
jgi:hypothetical protein